MERPVNLSPSTHYSFVSEGTSANDYLIPDRSLPQSARLPAGRFPFEHDLESQHTLSTAVNKWKQRNEKKKSFYRKTNPDSLRCDQTVSNIRNYLDNIPLSYLIRMLHMVREGIISRDTAIDIAQPMEYTNGVPQPPQISIQTLIDELDQRFHDWLNHLIEEHDLRKAYGEIDEEPLIPQPPSKTSRWLLVSLAALLFTSGVFSFFLYRCHDNDCFAWLPNRKEAIGYQLKTLPLQMNSTSFYLRETKSYIMVIGVNETEDSKDSKDSMDSMDSKDSKDSMDSMDSINFMQSLNVKFNHSTLMTDGKWHSIKQLKNDCQFPGVEDKSNCSIFHPFYPAKSEQKMGKFLGDKSFSSEDFLYLFACDGDCETRQKNDSNSKVNHILFKWNSDGKLIPFGTIQKFLDTKKQTFWDALFDSYGIGVILVGNAEKMQLCDGAFVLEKKPAEFVVSKCYTIGKLPCSTKHCTYTMKRWSASYYLLISHPKEENGHVIVSYYDKNQEKLCEKRIETSLPAKNALFLKRDHEPFMICYTEISNLLCRAYAQFEGFPFI